MPFLNKYKIPIRRTQEEKANKNGLRNAIYSANGKDVYIGEWKDNLKSGKGTLISNNKWVYEGDWLNGKQHGYGILSKILENSTRVLVYEGDWLNGNSHGFGTKTYNNGSIYEGVWENGVPSGIGRMWFKDGSFYDGEWLEGKQHGNGLFVYANSNRYEGEWVCGLKHGAGTFYHMNTGQKQKGVWKNDISVVSLMSDLCCAEKVKNRTLYPIPKIELKNYEEIFSKREEVELRLCEIAQLMKKPHVSFENKNTKENVNRIVDVTKCLKNCQFN